MGLPSPFQLRRVRRPGGEELLTGIEGASSRPVRRIVLITYPMLRTGSAE